MSYYMRLQNLPIEASSRDIRHFFKDHIIPKGGIHIVGGIDEEAFINFSDELDLLKALQLDNQLLLGQPVRLLLEKKDNEEHNQFKELLEIGKPTSQHQQSQYQQSQHQPFYHPEEKVIEPERPITPVPPEPQALFGQPVKFVLAKKEEQKSAMPALSNERFGTTASQWFKRQLGISADDSSSESDEEPQSCSSREEVKTGESRFAIHKSRWDARNLTDGSDRKEEVKKDDTRHVVHKSRWDASSCSEESDREEVKSDESTRVVSMAPMAPKAPKRRWDVEKANVEKANQVKDSRTVEVKNDGSLSIIRTAYSGSSSESSEDERERSRSRHDRYERSKRHSRERERDRKDSRQRYRSYSSRRSEEKDRSEHRWLILRRRERRNETKLEDIPHERDNRDGKAEKENAFLAAAHVVVSNLDCTVTSKAIREFFSGFEIPENGITLKVISQNPNSVKAGVIFPQRAEATKAEKMHGTLNGRVIKIKFFSRRIYKEEMRGMKDIVEEDPDPEHYSRIEGPPNVISEEQQSYEGLPNVNPKQYTGFEDSSNANPQQHPGFDSSNIGGVGSSGPPPPWASLPEPQGAFRPTGQTGMVVMAPGLRPPGPQGPTLTRPPGPMQPGFGPGVVFGPRGSPGFGPPMPMPLGPMPPGFGLLGPMPSGPMPPGFGQPGSMPLRSMPPGPMPSGFGPPGSMPSGPMPSGFGPPGSMPSGPMPPGFGPPGPMRAAFGPPGFRPPGRWSPHGPPGPIRPLGPIGPPGPSFPQGFRGSVPPQSMPQVPPVSQPRHKRLSTDCYTPSEVYISKKPVMYHSSAESELCGTNEDPIPIAELCGTNQGHIRIEDLDATVKASELWSKLTDSGAKPNSVALVQGPDGKAVFAFAAYRRTIDRLKFVNFNLKGMTCTLASQKARTTELVDLGPKHQISMASNSTDNHVVSERQLYTLNLSVHEECSKQERQAQEYQESLRLMCVDLNTEKNEGDVTPTKKELDGKLIEDPRKVIKLNLKQQRKAEKYQEGLRLMCMDINTVKEKQN